MQRRHRLSRSRDFDAVYRHGRSVSTRFLVLYWFEREDEDGAARLGLAVPRRIGGAVARNRLKRRLKEVWWQLLPGIPAGSDYVLVVRLGLLEAAETRSHEWLSSRIEEIVRKAGA